ncbi:MAG: alpha/beta hydrolase family protein [Planctomycetota bacterium]|jgi:poly(3-hydroxybutyrate) depolymerase
MIRMLLMTALLLLVAGVDAASYTTKGPLKGPDGRDYWIALPDNFDPERTYWLAVGCHGFKGTGEQGIGQALALAKGGFDDFIAVGCTGTKEDHIFADQATCDQIIGLFKQLGSQYKLHPKLFICGFSGGSQLSHRFTMKFPELVIGCSSHSGGSWGGAGNPKAAAGIPLSMSCGLDDTGSSMGAPRIEAMYSFYQALLKTGMHLNARVWAGLEHKMGDGARQQVIGTYRLATTGLFPCEQKLVDEEIARVRALIDAGEYRDAEKAIRDFKKFAQKLPPPARKDPPFAANPADQGPHREALIKAGLGGPSKKLKKDFWIDDRNENQYGWLDGKASMTQRRINVYARLKALGDEWKDEIKELKKKK